MSDLFQTRRDVDRLYDYLYDYENESLKVVSFTEASPLRNIGNESNQGTLDAIIEYYQLDRIDEKLDDIIAGSYDLSGYVKTEDLNTILSSYATISFANSTYAPIVHTHSQYVTREELSDLDINLTTLQLVPYSDNPNGVMCFERVQKTIDELDIQLSVTGGADGYLEINAELIEVQTNAS